MPITTKFDQDAIIETIKKTISALEQYLPPGENELYEELLFVYNTLASRRDAEREKYKDKADYHKEHSRQWRKNNKERLKEHSKNYNGKPCTCSDKNIDNWYIIGAPSNSLKKLIRCKICGSQWRTSAKYCIKLKSEIE